MIKTFRNAAMEQVDGQAGGAGATLDLFFRVFSPQQKKSQKKIETRPQKAKGSGLSWLLACKFKLPSSSVCVV